VSDTIDRSIACGVEFCDLAAGSSWRIGGPFTASLPARRCFALTSVLGTIVSGGSPSHRDPPPRVQRPCLRASLSGRRDAIVVRGFVSECRRHRAGTTGRLTAAATCDAAPPDPPNRYRRRAVCRSQSRATTARCWPTADNDVMVAAEVTTSRCRISTGLMF